MFKYCGRSSSVEHQLPKLDRRVQFPPPAVFILLMFFCGCATYEEPGLRPTAGLPGVYHRVEGGQTLYRISRMYNVDLDEIVSVNRITDASKIEPGQSILIPNRLKQATSLQYLGEDFVWPVRGRVIGNFGQLINSMVNKGLNIQAPKGADVIASRSGKVVFSSDRFMSFGKTLIIDHGQGFMSVYARNLSVLVKIGDRINKGDIIAKVGSFGRDKSSYLHFEIVKGHIPQNPYYYLAH
jgi:LysM repeat protein